MTLISLQVSYVVLGVLMNLMSLWHHRKTGHYYTPTLPSAGLATMGLYALCLPLRFLDYQLPFKITMAIFVIVLGTGGVLKHLVSGSTQRYASPRSRWAAIAINIYGVGLSAFALV
jgi:hypothetical protein